MKTLFACLAALVLIAASERPATAAASVSVDFFYDTLAPYGDWVQVEGYGYCFRPSITLSDPGWKPYGDGSWVYTEAGWTWDSDEDFGWAAYHYGRWFLLGGIWLWQPGETWGPAWVSWRTGDDFVGWAPLPPEATWQPEVGFNIYVDVDYNIGPAWYNFIPIQRFGELRLRKWLEPWQRNDDCMRATVNHTRITHRTTNNAIMAVFNEGPNLDRVAQLSERGVRRMKLVEHEGIDITDPSTRLRNWSENDSLRVIAPRVQRRSTESVPKLVTQRFDRTQVNRGWDGYPSESVEDLRAKADKLAKRDRSKDDRAPRVEPATGPQETPVATREPLPATAAGATQRDRDRDPNLGKRKERGTAPTASAIQEAPPTSPPIGEATSRPGPVGPDSKVTGRNRPEEPEGISKRGTRPDSELRKALPVTPGIQQDDKRLTPPERLRNEPQETPPRRTDPRPRPGDSELPKPQSVRPERTGPSTPTPQRLTPPPQSEEIRPLTEAPRIEPPKQDAVEHPPQPDNRTSLSPSPTEDVKKKGGRP
ncbi:hypothetical protein AYO49_04370 [Verrucomicrobiaceae bacterium SCGC AG-212-N21]|nr:hypothetical protein AYO49_04370 [Verrucomicrobiaceae bacterium SCGC AG-212-N21]